MTVPPSGIPNDHSQWPAPPAYNATPPVPPHPLRRSRTLLWVSGAAGLVIGAALAVTSFAFFGGSSSAANMAAGLTGRWTGQCGSVGSEAQNSTIQFNSGGTFTNVTSSGSFDGNYIASADGIIEVYTPGVAQRGEFAISHNQLSVLGLGDPVAPDSATSCLFRRLN